MFNLFKKEETPNVMFLRLQTLDKKVKFILKNKEFAKGFIEIFNGDFVKTFSVETALGKRDFTLTTAIPDFNTSEHRIQEYELEMCRYEYDFTDSSCYYRYYISDNYTYYPAGTSYLTKRTIFIVKATKKHVEVKPSLTEELKAKDIDLAILELENIIDDVIEHINSESGKHYLEVEKLKNGTC